MALKPGRLPDAPGGLVVLDSNCRSFPTSAEAVAHDPAPGRATASQHGHSRGCAAARSRPRHRHPHRRQPGLTASTEGAPPTVALRRTRPAAGRHADGGAGATATAAEVSVPEQTFGDDAWT